MTMYLPVIVLTFGLCSAIMIDVDMNKAIQTVEDKFISFNLDFGLVQKGWQDWDFKSTRLRTLLRGLSPAFLRLGGSGADWGVFDVPYKKLNITGGTPAYIGLTTQDWDNLVNITLATGLNFLFDFNLQLRYGTRWDPSNAIRLFEYCVSKGYGQNLDFELGNEPLYGAAGQARPSGSQIGLDFVSLRRLLDSYPTLRHCRLVGADMVAVESTPAVQKLLKEFLNAVKRNISAVTWHHYYFRGDLADVKTYLDAKNFDGFISATRITQNIIANSSAPDLPLWLGETSDAWHEGTANISDRFVSGFLWLDKLGVAARMGTKVVMRQTFFGYNYCLVDKYSNPNPDYWLSYVHKQLVGTSVLGLKSDSVTAGLVRAYSHCTNPKSMQGYRKGAVTVFALNLSNSTADTLRFTSPLSNQAVDVFLMEPGDALGMLSKFVKVNGLKMNMPSDATLPPLSARHQSASQGVKIPPLTFVFLVFPEAKASACL